MNSYKIFPAGDSAALDYAVNILKNSNLKILHSPDRSATHLLLPVPSFSPDDSIRGGKSLEDLLGQLPKNITVIGGNLNHHALDGYQTIDLLQNPTYVSKNANITAHCAIRLGMQHLPCTLENCPILVIGWGRIGKCLAKLLKSLGSNVTVAARKESDRAMLQALGYCSIHPEVINPCDYKLIYNTVPVMLLPNCPGDALKIDLASQPGISGNDVLWARGLPGKDAPESSGMLITQTIIDHFGKEKIQ